MGTLFNIQPFSIHDGPGVRTSVFLKGCALACRWCHNPESQSAQREILYHQNRCAGCGACVLECPRASSVKTARGTSDCIRCGACAEACYAGALESCGYEISPEDLAARVLKDKSIFETSGGGVTFTGGEPLLQPDFVCETARLLKAEHIHLTIETCLHASEKAAQTVLPLMDLVYADVKCVTDETHIRGTGANTRLIRKNLEFALSACPNIILRTPVVPGFNDNAEELARIADLEASLGVHHIELMTFHNTCAGKYAALGRRFDYAAVSSPAPEQMEGFADIFRQRGLSVTIH